MSDLKIHIRNLGLASNHSKSFALQWLVRLGFFGQLNGLSPLLWNLVNKPGLLAPNTTGHPGTVNEIISEMLACVDNGTMSQENLQFIKRLIDAEHWGDLRRVPRKDPKKDPLTMHMKMHGMPIQYEDWSLLVL